MRFSDMYTKLQDRVFTTIRTGDLYEEGQVIDCRTPVGVIRARVLLKFSIRFGDLPEPFLQYDTDGPGLSAAEIRDKIRGLYRRSTPPSDNSDVTVYFLEKLKGADSR